MWMVVVNRSLAIACIWLMAYLINVMLDQRNRSLRNQQHLAAAQQIAHSGSFELNFRTMVLRGSRAFDAMHARRTRDGSWAAFVDQKVAPDDRPALAALLARARDGIDPDPFEFSFLGPDNVARNAVLHAQLVTGAGGAVTGLIGVVQDVTEARKAQAQQAEIEAQLRHAQKLEALGELSGGIAHDLNNTLLPVTMLVPALLKTAQGNLREGLEIIAAAADRARELVREILAFSRKDPAARAPLRLDQLVRQALPILRAGIPATINIATDLVEVPEILGNKGQLYQTLLNLVTNGARAIGSKPGTVTISVGRDRDGGVHLSVVDDGVGMDSAMRARIFEPFFTSRPEAGGTGLGLAIVHGIVNTHGGTINVASSPGEGTRFDLVFPPLKQLEPV
jgi:signal transduction histidine kinase